MKNFFHISQKFKAIQNQVRLEIVNAIIKAPSGRISVTDLMKTLDMSQAKISQQLSILRYARLIRSQRDGQRTIYSIADDKFFKSIIRLFG